MASLHTHTHFTNSPCTSYMQTCTSSPKQSEPPMHCKDVIMNTELRGIKTKLAFSAGWCLVPHSVSSLTHFPSILPQICRPTTFTPSTRLTALFHDHNKQGCSDLYNNVQCSKTWKLGVHNTPTNFSILRFTTPWPALGHMKHVCGECCVMLAGRERSVLLVCSPGRELH